MKPIRYAMKMGSCERGVTFTLIKKDSFKKVISCSDVYNIVYLGVSRDTNRLRWKTKMNAS